MNEIFWFAVLLLIVGALSILVLPLLRNRELPESDIAQRNIKIARQRLADLKQQFEDGELSEAQYDEQYQELELNLNDDLDSVRDDIPSARQGKWVIAVILLFVPVFSMVTYLSLGETQALNKAQQQQLASQREEDARQTINKMVSGLAERLQTQPDDAEGWLMLGRSYKYMQQYSEAASAFSKAYHLLGDEPSVLLNYADALAMASGGKLSGKPAQLVFKALEIAPNDVTGLWLGGMAKAESGDFSQALKYWQTLESLVPKDTPSYQELQGLMTALKARMAEDGDEQAVAASVAPQPVKIQVRVDIDDALRKQVQDNDTLFVYAQALQGPKMPLAIVRNQVADLPLSTQLNDAMAMTPALKLSSFDQVKVIARISKTGNAMQQPGDLLGFAELSGLGPNSSINITINQRVN